jgi:FkbM family methyltransferase
MKVTREHVIWAYRLFLGREPESEEVIEVKVNALDSIHDLRRDFVSCAEFRSQISNVPPVAMTNIVIKEIGSGLRMFLDLAERHVGRNIIDGLYEPDEQEFVRRSVHAGDNTIDVGANIGLFTILMAAAVGHEGHVHAFEPLPRNAELLERSVVENGFSDRITVIRKALADAAGRLALINAATGNQSGGGYLQAMTDPVPHDHSATAVDVVMLDAAQLRRPISFIKMDCEGAEMLVLRGARNVLREDQPTVLAELNNVQLERVSGCSANDLISEMSRTGYHSRRLAPGGELHDIKSHDSDEVTNVVFSSNRDR